LAVLVVLGFAGFAGATALEEHDPFCTSCHTAPEITYFNRAYIALDYPDDPIPDLSTVHYHLADASGGHMACIACHRGDASPGHRIAAIALGAWDAGIWLVGQDDPTIEKAHVSHAWLTDSACVSCHADTLTRVDGLNTHYHNYLPQSAWVGVTTKTINYSPTCSDCHPAHVTIPNPQHIDPERRNVACTACHIAAGIDLQDVDALGN
jgi:hypothetical protein